MYSTHKLLVLLLNLSVLLLFSCALQAESKELRFVFQKQKNPATLEGEANSVGQYLSKKLGVEVKTQIPLSYAASVQALISGKAEIAYLDSVSYLLANKETDLEVLLAEVRADLTGTPRTEYDSLLVVRKDSDLKSYEDFLNQAKNLHFVFTSPTSTSGYLIPYRRFYNSGLVNKDISPEAAFKQVSFGGSYAGALQQVALGRADVAAVSFYSLEGPSANSYLPENEREKLRVLSRTPGVPTHVIAVSKKLSEELKQKIKISILEISQEQPELLADIYGAASFTEVDETKHLATSKEALNLLNLTRGYFFN